MRKILPIFLSMALLLTLFSQIGAPQTVSAATGSFVFPQESDKSTQARTITDPRITLSGTITGVDPSSISYSIYQVVNNKGTDDPNDDQIGSKRENLTSNIYVNDYSIQIYNMELFPGLNRITFRGTQGGGEVTNSIYINYHNGPVFYDLVAQLDGNYFPIEEAGTTVVQSTTSAGRQEADISITGYAPNAQQVTVLVNGGNSKTYSVSSTNNYQFAASPIKLQKGKNLITIQVKNATQTIETTREIAFYNGDVTFYDVNIIDGSSTGTAKEALEYSPDLILGSTRDAKITGKIIVPNHLATDTSSPTVPVPHPNPALDLNFEYTIRSTTDNTSFTQPSGTIAKTIQTYTGQEPYFIYEFTTPIGTNHTLDFNKNYLIQLLAKNEKKAALGQASMEGTGWMSFSLRNGAAKFIDAINYLPGYQIGSGSTPNNGESLTGSPLEGANLYGVPFAMEVLVGNPTPGSTAELVSVVDVKNITNTSGTAVYENVSDTLTNPYVTVNGKLYKREILVFKTLPFEGTQTVTLQVGTGTDAVTKTVKFSMLFGPYVEYTSIFDNMTVYDDTNKAKADRIAATIVGEFSNFAGKINNINNTSEIRYDYVSGTGGGAQTVFFYVNNTPIKLKQQTGKAKTEFIVADDANRDKAFNALFSGENEIRFVFQGSKNSYEKTIKVYFIPTNLPVIPVAGTTIYPYSSNYDTPLANDPNFVYKGGLYSTSQEGMNIFGTFDFIDFNTYGSSNADIVRSIETQLTNMTTNNELTHPSQYILKIDSTGTATIPNWDLSKHFVVMKGSEVIGNINDDPNKRIPNLTVRYDVDTKSFSFILSGQKLNPNGSSSVYVFTVFNNGLTGPKASFRVEVDPTSLPYTILRPFLPAQNIVNQNFIEVVINAEGADSIVINKQVAEKIEFDNDNNPATPKEHNNTFRVFVSNLKVGANKIDFTIKSANDEVKSSFTITYAPTNIPGAQYLQTMTNNHKIFDGALTLKFDKGTTLIRTDYNVPQNLKNQVFTGHNLLFGIANGEDGVVNRRELESLPPNFNIILESFGTRFRLSYPTRFTKASPVYWIDAGLADDPTTAAYDPLTMGVDPYQFPGATGTNNTKIPTYDERPDDRELVASKTGELTLAFDPDMRDAVGTIITVFRYDVKAKYWENMGGVVDTKKNTITVPFTKFGYYVVGKMVYSFTDMTSHPYARNHLEAIFSKGVMNPAGFDDFGANMYVSRGEFARMMVKALDIPLNYELSKPHFDDVPAIINPDALWDYRYIETAAREGIIRGTGARTFSPGANLTREDAAVIIARALELKLDTDISKVTKNLEKQFKDAGSVEYYAKASVAAIAKKGYIQGSLVDVTNPKAGYVFEPKSNLLRSDAAIIVSRILADLKRLPNIY